MKLIEKNITIVATNQCEIQFSTTNPLHLERIKVRSLKRWAKLFFTLAFTTICFAGCKIFDPIQTTNSKTLPTTFQTTKDSTNSAQIKWNDFFVDKNLVSLIDSALKNNIDLLITLQDIEIARNNVRVKKGMILPTVNAGAGLGIEKVGLYTSQGAGDASAEITPGKIVPENLKDYKLGLNANWEVDIWKKLRNAKKGAVAKYLSSIEGKNFVISNLVAEISNAYYELLSLDNQLDIIRETIQLQKNALEIVKVQKQASVVTELAVKKFEAEVLNSQSMEYQILQQIKETENEINFLVGRFPQSVNRNKSSFATQIPISIQEGIPSQLLKNRPDIRQAELELYAAKCDVKMAQAEFYPSLNISGSLGYNAFKASYLFTSPQSLMYSLAGELIAPLVNRSAIKAEFNNAKAMQIQAMYDYQKSILTGFTEVSNQLSNINNLEQQFNLKNKEVEAHLKSIEISNDLFKSAKADYFEVLMTQRDALASRLELMELRKQQLNATTNLYKALGGGWR
jgi:NodT family efflux transporter outer membrane factor (OMF) lipoprotein